MRSGHSWPLFARPWPLAAIGCGLLLAGCYTTTPQRVFIPLTGDEPVDLTVAVSTTLTEGAFKKPDLLSPVLPKALREAGIFRRIIYPEVPYEPQNPDLRAHFSVISRHIERDSLQDLKVYGTVLSGLLLSPFIQYHDAVVLVGELELIAGRRALRKYVAKGSAVTSYTVFGDWSSERRDAVDRAAMESLRARKTINDGV